MTTRTSSFLGRRSRSPRPRRGAFAGPALLERLEQRLAPAVFTVTTTDDNGDDVNPPPGSLRAAILGVNASVDAENTINFAIPGAGLQTIAVTGTGLPDHRQDGDHRRLHPARLRLRCPADPAGRDRHDPGHVRPDPRRRQRLPDPRAEHRQLRRRPAGCRHPDHRRVEQPRPGQLHRHRRRRHRGPGEPPGRAASRRARPATSSARTATGWPTPRGQPHLREPQRGDLRQRQREPRGGEPHRHQCRRHGDPGQPHPRRARLPGDRQHHRHERRRGVRRPGGQPHLREPRATGSRSPAPARPATASPATASARTSPAPCPCPTRAAWSSPGVRRTTSSARRRRVGRCGRGQHHRLQLAGRGGGPRRQLDRQPDLSQQHLRQRQPRRHRPGSATA